MSAANRSLDSSPLIPGAPGRRAPRLPTLAAAARFLRRAGSRRIMREPSLIVRDSAAEQLEERQSDWAYSRPVVLLDMVWNFAFVAVAAGVLFLSREEQPIMPLRLWVVGYALQCAAHMVCVGVEYRKRTGAATAAAAASEPNSPAEMSAPADLERGASAGRYGAVPDRDSENVSVAKHLESANTMFSFIWWIIGFYWVSTGGSALTSDSPQLYWLCIVFLAFDVFFVVFCVALACVIGIAVCCCLPCIIAILYAVADQEGASDEDIHQLPKYIFRRTGDSADAEKLDDEISKPSGGIMTECGSDAPLEHEIAAENAECCICLSTYEDGVELRQLPCNHHFHSPCIDKWLYLNATCPLCKYNIIKSSNNGTEEV
ncbi:putative E3 ubiquitin-protein ligase [Iris pallida]|uniref:RING-type E3 ubiquitin transferase n=1 Tax=Iris pallida TaxID=29817 RepID=A0AAX6DZU8_IRIPA|nr:putative E3 ubiquitin-protein ligase [Iris pallida]